jgi:hypothetical protein
MWLLAKNNAVLSLAPKEMFRVPGMLFTLISALLIFESGIAQEVVDNNAFQVGEELIYEVNYSSPLGKFNAGTARMKVDTTTYNGRPIYHIVGIGETNNFFDMFYKVRDRFETRMDRETLLPYEFTRRTREADFVLDDDVIFDHESKTSTSRRKTKSISSGTHDIISGVYFMRTLSIDDFGTDSLYYLDFFLDDSLYHSVINYDGRVVLETEWGYIPCIKITPMVVTGEIFSRNYPMSVWVTDDENHIPVFAESEIIIGSVQMILKDFNHLKNPFIRPLSRKEAKNLIKRQ